ncbi:MAG: hypothetical protein CMJ20_04100 [Phycisphaeraceae bacterium]|nr:hypothetical protein [Phycisphaeraceae bacterium]
MPSPYTLRGNDRLIYFADTGLHAYNTWEPVTADQFRQHMNDFADNGIDIYSQLTFSAGALKPGLFVPDHPEFKYWPNNKFQSLVESGVQPLEIMIDQAHKRGIKFFCKLRLTDWHRKRSIAESGFIGRHPEFCNPDRKTRQTLDYSHQEVRDYHADLIRELSSRFDIDGITLNFTRGLAYFPKNTKVDRHVILTDFVRQIRDVLDDQTRTGGRRLQLNAIVWPHLGQCNHYGADVATWIGDDLVDHLCPGNTHTSDPAMDHEAFSALCRQSQCKYFPMLQPTLWAGQDITLISPDHVRALAKGMYGGGADGISVFNWQFHWDIRGGRGPSGVTHGPWSACRVVNTSEVDYPRSLHCLRQLQDPSLLDKAPRKYYFRSLDLKDELSYELFEDSYRVVLPRKAGASGVYQFQLPEDIAATGGAYLVARLFGLSPLEEIGGKTVIGPADDVSGPEFAWRWPDELDVNVNGIDIPSQLIQKVWHNDGRTQARGKQMAPYTSLWFKLAAPPARRGLNTLGITLSKLEPLDAKEVVIEELEVTVMPPPVG